MPKSYSESEKQAIRESLLFHGAQCLSAYGVKRTTVDEIVRRAKIPKGTFYLFYESKEVLLFGVLLRWHDEIQKTILGRVEELGGKLDADGLTDILMGICTQVEQTGLMQMFSTGELEALARKLPPEMVAEHLLQDEDMVAQLIRFIPSAAEKDTAVYSAAFRGVFLMTLQKAELGESYEEALRLLIRGISIQLTEEENHD